MIFLYTGKQNNLSYNRRLTFRRVRVFWNVFFTVLELHTASGLPMVTVTSALRSVLSTYLRSHTLMG
uniref:Uncharacterized protein n=1 Tax=Anguilla anguilla TaxID=7936 RepID=A0A0E9TRN9_ANGAN